MYSYQGGIYNKLASDNVGSKLLCDKALVSFGANFGPLWERGK